MLPAQQAPVRSLAQVVPVDGNSFAGEAFDALDASIRVADAEPREARDRLEIHAPTPAARAASEEARAGVKTATERMREARHACQWCLEACFRVLQLNQVADSVAVDPDWDQPPEVRKRNRDAREAARARQLEEKLAAEEEARIKAEEEFLSDSEDDEDEDEDEEKEEEEEGGPGE